MPEKYDLATIEMLIDLIIEVQNAAPELVEDKEVQNKIMKELLVKHNMSLKEGEFAMSLFKGIFPLSIELSCGLLINEMNALKEAIKNG